MSTIYKAMGLYDDADADDVIKLSFILVLKQNKWKDILLLQVDLNHVDS